MFAFEYRLSSEVGSGLVEGIGRPWSDLTGEEGGGRGRGEEGERGRGEEGVGGRGEEGGGGRGEDRVSSIGTSS